MSNKFERSFQTVYGNAIDDGQYADPHVHTFFSDGYLSPKDVIIAAAEKGIHTVAITDHDTLAGIESARQIGERYGVQVIAGIEISSLDGHIGALFPDTVEPHRVPYGHSAEQTIYDIKNHGGLAVGMHPGAAGVSSLQGRKIANLNREAETRLDLLELWNWGIKKAANMRYTPIVGRFFPQADANQRTQSFFRSNRYGFAKSLPIGGSDAHDRDELGKVRVRFPQGMTLFDALKEKEYSVEMSTDPTKLLLLPTLYAYYRYALNSALMKLGKL